MLCSKLATRGDGFRFPCGQCLNCRVNRRRDWQARLLLEAASHEYSVFITLTFRDVGTPNILRKSDLKTFYRNLRKSYPDVRHFSAGEYGTKTARAHYHAHIFSHVAIPDFVFRDCWPYGNIHIGETEPASIDYVLGYLLKDKKSVLRPIELRFPEFHSSSKGLGKFAFEHLVISSNGSLALPREFKVFGKKWPIGRYFREKAKFHGYQIKETVSSYTEKIEAQALRSLLSNAKSPEEVQAVYDQFWKSRAETSAKLKAKAIRAAYLEQHGFSRSWSKQNETF